MARNPSISAVAGRYNVGNGKNFRLKDFDPEDTMGIDLKKEDANALLTEGVAQLAEMQGRLYAQDKYSVLLIFQAMDAAGKDGTIKHVMSGVNPQGCEVHAFKAPSAEELDHDFLWRCLKVMPRRGHIGIFNRSYYEETLVVRVHPELLARQKMPEKLVTKDIWQERYQDIRSFERYLARQGVVIRKFFLYVSRKEQRKRFLERLEQPEKHWKFSLADAHEREHFGDYQKVYEDMIRHTSTKESPWFVVPADNKWFTRLVVAAAVIQTLRDINPKYPKVDAKQLREFNVAKAALLSEGKS